jgi:predicted transcriptional regulator
MTGRKKGSNSLTPLELQIMQVLWSDGQSNVLQVQKSLAPNNDLAYNTVQTMLNILHRKARVQRTLKGRAYFYRPIASREKFLRQAVLEFVERLFGGSSEELVMSLIKSRQLDPERIVDLGRKLATREKGGRDD